MRRPRGFLWCVAARVPVLMMMSLAWTGAVPAAPFTVVAVGDIMLDGSARPTLADKGYGHAFDALRDVLSSADITFGNLEGPLTARGEPAPDKRFVFRSPPAPVARALRDAGFDVLSLANNHSLDYGPDGLADTQSALAEEGLKSVGAGADLAAARQPVIMTVKGVRVAFLAYSLTFPEEFWATETRPGTAFGHEGQLREDVRHARDRADVVLVSFHWGVEGKTELRDYQTTLAYAAVDAGASAVLGHHPHVLQAVERYGEGVILYSLGNFAFGSFSPTAARSMVARLEFDGSGTDRPRLTGVRLLPINVNNFEVYFQPRKLPRAAADETVAHLSALSEARETAITARDGEGWLALTAIIRP